MSYLVCFARYLIFQPISTQCLLDWILCRQFTAIHSRRVHGSSYDEKLR